MTEPSQKIVLPAYLIRRLEAFRIAKGGEQSYILRDKPYGKTYDFDPWQFFVLEVLPGCETLDKLQSVFRDRFGREIGQDELEILFASIADQKLFDESALQHPLLEQYAKRTFEVVDGKAVHKSFSTVGQAVPAAAVGTPADGKATGDGGAPELPPGIEGATGVDSRAASRMLKLFDPRPMLKALARVTPTIDPDIEKAVSTPGEQQKIAFLLVNSRDLIERLNGEYGTAMGLGAGFSFADGD